MNRPLKITGQMAFGIPHDRLRQVRERITDATVALKGQTSESEAQWAADSINRAHNDLTSIMIRAIRSAGGSVPGLDDPPVPDNLLPRLKSILGLVEKTGGDLPPTNEPQRKLRRIIDELEGKQ